MVVFSEILEIAYYSLLPKAYTVVFCLKHIHRKKRYLFLLVNFSDDGAEFV